MNNVVIEDLILNVILANKIGNLLEMFVNVDKKDFMMILIQLIAMVFKLNI